MCTAGAAGFSWEMNTVAAGCGAGVAITPAIQKVGSVVGRGIYTASCATVQGSRACGGKVATVASQLGRTVGPHAQKVLVNVGKGVSIAGQGAMNGAKITVGVLGKAIGRAPK